MEDYETAMVIKNASELIMVCYLPMMVKDVARNWIHGLRRQRQFVLRDTESLHQKF
jgi:hypothetical protein